MRFSDPKPAYCSACFHQNLDEAFVDFEAYWDGPVIDSASGVKQAIDDLHLCESCLDSAARLLGYDKPLVLQAENERLAAELEAEKARALKAEAHAAQLHDALSTKPEAREKRVFAKA